MTIGELNRRIEVLENQVTRDEYGGEESKWITVGRVWAKIEPSSGKEFLAGQQVQAEHTTRFTIRFYPALDVMHRIRYQDKTYEIIGVGDLDASHKWTVVTAKEMVSDGLQRKTAENESGSRGYCETCKGTQIDGGWSVECVVKGC